MKRAAKDLETLPEDDLGQAVEDAFGGVFDDPLGVLPPPRGPARDGPDVKDLEERGWLVDDAVIDDDATPSQIEADLDGFFDMVEAEQDHFEEVAAADGHPHRPRRATGAGVYARSAKDGGLEDSVVDVLVDYVACIDREPAKPPKAKSSQLFKKVALEGGTGWAIVPVEPPSGAPPGDRDASALARRRQAPTPEPRRERSRRPGAPPPRRASPRPSLNEVEGLVVGGEASEVGAPRSPVPEVKVTSIDLAALRGHLPARAFDLLESTVEVLRGIGDECFGEGKHRTAIQPKGQSQALAVARPRRPPEVEIRIVQDEDGDIAGAVDLSGHPSLADATNAAALHERVALFIVRTAQSVYADDVPGFDPVGLLGDLVALLSYFWTGGAARRALEDARQGWGEILHRVGFELHLLAERDASRPRPIALTLTLGSSPGGLAKEELLPRSAFRHVVLARSSSDGLSMDFELYPRTDLELDADGSVIGPDGRRYPIDFPGVMSHLKI